MYLIENGAYPLKYFKISVSVYELFAMALIVLATVLRVTLAYQHWPLSNSDEGTMGIMALHIFSHGEHPIFFYGQNYMGATEAYIGAALFHVYGVSLFTLRLGLILLFIIFLISTYLVASMLYTKAVGLGSLFILSLGSIAVVSRQLMAIGGYAETITCGSLAFLLASWLALSSQDVYYSKRWQRLVGYGTWGLIVGLGIWSDFLVLPFVLCSALLLLFFCWRELLQLKDWAILCLLLGLIIGIFPLIFYSILAEPGQSTLATMLQLQGGRDITYNWITQMRELKQTIQVAIPTATGNPFCSFSEFPKVLLLGPSTPPSFQCTLINTSWGVGYVFLWLTSACLSLVSLWKTWKSSKSWPGSLEERRFIIRLTGQILLLCSAGLAIVLFVFSTSSLKSPSVHSRYLMGVLIATPALIAPLWVGSHSLKPQVRFRSMRAIIRGSLFLLISILFLLGMVYTLYEIPAAQAADRQENSLIDNLVHIGATHIYTDYWTCNRIAFQSNERIICGVLDSNLHPANNRDPHYYAIVSADSHSFYVFPGDVPQATIITQKFTRCGKTCRHFDFSGYVVYQPI